MIIVFDMDGVLADDRHRLHYITQTPKDYDKFYAGVLDDPPITPMVTLAITMAQAGHKLEIWTNRRESSRADTEKWLDKYTLWDIQKLRMRPDKEHRSAVEVKKGWMESCFPCERPDMVFEDQTKNVEMFRSFGIIVCQTLKDGYELPVLSQ